MNRLPLGILLGFVLGSLAPVSALAREERRSAIVRAVAKTRDAIVNLRTLRRIPARFEDAENGGRVKGLGTAVIYDPRGYIVTNYHVVEDVHEIWAVTSQNRTYPARVVAKDTRADIAILRMDPGDKVTFSYLPLWGAGKPILGETVIAIGNPYGYENSVSTGIVSAVDRELKLPNGETFDDLLQTDASINPGNSGGPLLNINGDLLGMNAAIRTNAQGIGFAIPTEKIRAIIQRLLLDKATIPIAKYGLVTEEAVRVVADTDGPSPSLVKIGYVLPNSHAQKTGFRTGDEVVAIDGQTIKMQFDLQRVLWGRRYGDSLTFTIRHQDGKSEDINMTFAIPKDLSDSEVLWHEVGIRVSKVSAERVRQVYSELNGGLLLMDVASGSPADNAALQPGDIMVGLHTWETIDANNVRFVMQWKDLTRNLPIECHYIRDGKFSSCKIRLPVHP